MHSKEDTVKSKGEKDRWEKRCKIQTVNWINIKYTHIYIYTYKILEATGIREIKEKIKK